jgi:cytochrome c-type biogenesis protein CcmF
VGHGDRAPGIAVALFGMASDSAFSTEKLAAMTVGDTQNVGRGR